MYFRGICKFTDLCADLRLKVSPAERTLLLVDSQYVFLYSEFHQQVCNMAKIIVITLLPPCVPLQVHMYGSRNHSQRVQNVLVMHVL